MMIKINDKRFVEILFHFCFHKSSFYSILFVWLYRIEKRKKKILAVRKSNDVKMNFQFSICRIAKKNVKNLFDTIFMCVCVCVYFNGEDKLYVIITSMKTKK